MFSIVYGVLIAMLSLSLAFWRSLSQTVKMPKIKPFDTFAVNSFTLAFQLFSNPFGCICRHPISLAALMDTSVVLSMVLAHILRTIPNRYWLPVLFRDGVRYVPSTVTS